MLRQKERYGLAAICWATGEPFGVVLQRVAQHLGVERSDQRCDSGIVAGVAKAKGISLESLLGFGACAGKRGKAQVCRIPVYAESGKSCSHFDIGIGGEKLNKGLFARGKPAGVFLPHEDGKPRIPRRDETWLLVEGVKDAAALSGLGFNAIGMPTCQMQPRFATLLSGCHVVVVPDLDIAGWEGSLKTSARLIGIAASVRVARLPGEMKDTNGDDARDVLRKRNGAKLVRNAVEAAKDASQLAVRSRPVVTVTMDEVAVADKTLNALAELGWENGDERLRIYQRGGKLVQLTRDMALTVAGVSVPANLARIRQIPAPILRERIADAVELVSDDDDQKPLRPPGWLVSAIHQRGEYPLAVRPLAGIVQAPTLRPDGTLLQKPGYDPQTKLIYAPAMDFQKVPEQPTRDDAVQSIRLLLDLISDFPFVDETSKSVCVALVLSLVGRPAIAGPCPMFVFDANTRGSGKSLLCDVASIVAFGTTAPRRAYPGKDEEVRKSITAIAMEGLPAVTFDDVSSGLGCASLNAALTGVTWTDRILGKNETTGTLPLTTVWMATGNNVVLFGDMSRRVSICRMESLHEHPEDCEDFQYRDLLSHVRDHRHILAPAAATILRAYFAAGRPAQKLPPWGSYEEWTRVVRGAITWCGYPDPAGTRQFARESDTDADLLVRLLNGIDEVDEGDGVLAGRIKKATESDDATCPILKAVIDELCGNRPDARKIGYRLRKFAGRVVGGRRLASRDSNAGKRWFVERMEYGSKSGDGGDRGDAGATDTSSDSTERDGVTYEDDRVEAESSPSSPPSPRFHGSGASQDELPQGQTRQTRGNESPTPNPAEPTASEWGEV